MSLKVITYDFAVFVFSNRVGKNVQNMSLPLKNNAIKIEGYPT